VHYLFTVFILVVLTVSKHICSQCFFSFNANSKSVSVLQYVSNAKFVHVFHISVVLPLGSSLFYQTGSTCFYMNSIRTYPNHDQLHKVYRKHFSNQHNTQVFVEKSHFKIAFALMECLSFIFCIFPWFCYCFSLQFPYLTRNLIKNKNENVYRRLREEWTNF